MKISAQEEYGLRCLLQLARAEVEGESLTLSQIARREGISAANAGKLMWILNKAGLVQSQRGTKGGYHLARPASAIHLNEVIRVLDERVESHCRSYTGVLDACVHTGDCGIRPVIVELHHMLRARIEPKFDTIPARFLVMFLAFAQPLVRGWSRYFTWLHFKRTPRAVITTHEHMPAGEEFTGSLRRRSYWSEEGKDRHHLLGSIFGLLDEEGWRYSTDTGWNEWDIQIYGNFWWSITLQTVTEYHGGPKCLTRAGLDYRFVTTTVIINLVLITLLVYHELNAGHADFWLFALYFLFVAFLANRARALKSRVTELVDVAAFRAGLRRIPRRTSAPETPPPPRTPSAVKAP